MTANKRFQISSVVTAPIFFGAFLIVPLIVILQRISGGSSLPPLMLMINNLLCLAWLVSRLITDMRQLRSGVRYGVKALFRGKAVTVPMDRVQMTEQLARRGYILDESGNYGERPDSGYWGRLILLAGLSFMLLVGSYDNLRQFSGTILLGVGQPLKLSEAESYGILTKGPLTSFDELPVKLQITRQVLPNGEFPQGATDIVIFDRDGKEQQHATIVPGAPLRIGAYEIHMARYVFDAWLVVTTTANHIVFTNFVKLLPLKEQRNGYTFYGRIDDDRFEKVKGDAWLKPQEKAVKLSLDYKGSRIVDTDLFLWGVNKKELDGYVAKIEGLGQWSEIHVSRSRHKSALFTGAASVLIGLLIRLFWRPRRVWIEERAGRTYLRTTDAQLLKAINEPPVDI